MNYKTIFTSIYSCLNPIVQKPPVRKKSVKRQKQVPNWHLEGMHACAPTSNMANYRAHSPPHVSSSVCASAELEKPQVHSVSPSHLGPRWCLLPFSLQVHALSHPHSSILSPWLISPLPNENSSMNVFSFLICHLILPSQTTVPQSFVYCSVSQLLNLTSSSGHAPRHMCVFIHLYKI